MVGIRTIKRRARSKLHQALSEPVWYLPSPDADPVPTTVRMHFSYDALGEVSRGFADRQDVQPTMIFLAAEVEPEEGGTVITEDLGAYRVANDLPPDDITIAAEVIKLTDSQITHFGWNPALPWMGLPPREV